jgi:YVTN family beta-propeller protein
VGLSSSGKPLKPLPLRTYRQRRRARARLVVVVLAVGLLVGLIVLVTGGSSKPKSSLAPGASATKPIEIAVVTEIGTGSSLETGSGARVIDLGAPSTTPSNEVRVGTFPDAVAISPDHLTAYVTNYSSDSVTPIDLLTDRPGKSIPAGPGPAGIAITPNGRTAYVTDAGSSPLGNTVTPINLTTKKPMRAIHVGFGPEGIAITPDGRTAYVADTGAIVAGQVGETGHTVTPINLLTNKAKRSIQVGNAPIAVGVSPDGSTAFVVNYNSGSLTPISVAADTPGTPIPVGGAPQAIAAIKAKNQVLVASAESGGRDSLTTISVATQTVTRSISVPANPTSLDITSDSKTAWVVANGANELVSVNLASGVVDSAHAIALPKGPYAVAIGTIPSGAATKLFARITKRSASTKSS